MSCDVLRPIVASTNMTSVLHPSNYSIVIHKWDFDKVPYQVTTDTSTAVNQDQVTNKSTHSSSISSDYQSPANHHHHRFTQYSSMSPHPLIHFKQWTTTQDGLDKLTLTPASIATDALRPDEVLVRIHAVALNYRDIEGM